MPRSGARSAGKSFTSEAKEKRKALRDQRALDQKIVNEGLFHRYQLTNEATEYRGEFVKLALDRHTGMTIPWMEKPNGV